MRFLDVDSRNIDNADGVQYLNSLTNLYLEGSYTNNGNLSSIDLSNNTALTNLDLGNNNISSIDLSQNITLTHLYLNENNLTSVDISNNIKLTDLYLGYNNISSIDLSHNTALKKLALTDDGFAKELSSFDKTIEIEQPDVVTAYPNDITYTIWDYGNYDNVTVAVYNNGVVEKLKAGTANLNIEYKVTDSISFDITYKINFIDINSTYYEINHNNKTIDLNGDILNNIYSNFSSFSIIPENCKLALNNDKLEIKDSSGNVVDTYLFINYKLFELTSSYYQINIKDKTIDANKEYLINISPSKFSITPYGYKLNINNDKLEIKDSSGNVIDTYTFKNYILYKLNSSSYIVNEEEKTIDVKGILLDNINTWNNFSITPSNYRLYKNNDKLEIRDNNGNVIDTYAFKNYKLYNLTSSYYTINEEEKTINLNKDLLSYVNNYKFSITPSYNYRLNVNNDKLEIKDSSGNVVDTYKFINYLKYKLNSSTYTIDDSNKTIDAKGNIFAINNIWINSSGQYDKRQNGNIIEILDSDKNVVDSYEIINEREKYEDAYLKAGFKDKNLYTCAVRSYVDSHYDDMNEKSEYISGDYLLTEEEMNNIDELYCVNKNISDTTGIEKLTNLVVLFLSYNNIETIDVSKNTNLNVLVLSNNKLTSLDVSKNPNLGHLEVPNNKIKRIKGLENLEGLAWLLVYNNNLSDLDISKTTNLEFLMVSNNPLANTLYMLKGKEIDYKKDFRLNEIYEIRYDVVDTNVVLYKDNKLKALKEGISNIYLSNEKIYVYKPELWDKQMKCGYLLDQKICEEFDNASEEDEAEYFLPYLINQEVKVYDITSKEYKVDKDKKTIDALNKDFDASKINLTLNELTGTLTDDKFIIKDKDVIVDTYTVTNIKKVIKEEVVSDSSNGTKVKPSDKVIEKIEERKEKAEEKLEDIIIEGYKVPLTTLLLVKGKDRNIIVKSNGITITINGRDIDKVTGNLDLSYELKPLKESTIYEEVKDKLKNGMVLRFKDNFSLPYKILVELNVNDNIEKNMKIKDINIYNYDNKLTLVAQKMNIKDNKFKFYVEKLGTYVLSDSEIKDSKINKTLVKENTKLDKKINTGIIVIGIFILLLILIIIGYINYKKNKDKNS